MARGESVERCTDEEAARAVRGVAGAAYGAERREHVLAIWRACLEAADRVSARRERTSSFFLAVQTALLALAGLAPASALPLVPATGALLSLVWWRALRSLRDLNAAKFRVLTAIEAELPVRPLGAEWELVGRGREPGLYLPSSRVEAAVPWLFLALHLALALA